MKKCCANCEFYTVDLSYEECCRNPVILGSLYDEHGGNNYNNNNLLQFDPDDKNKFFCSEFKPAETQKKCCAICARCANCKPYKEGEDEKVL